MFRVLTQLFLPITSQNLSKIQNFISEDYAPLQWFQGQSPTHSDFFHSKNSNNCFKCLASKIDSILGNYNYMGCLKAKKIKIGQKKPKKNFKAKTKAGYEKNSNFHIFSAF